MNDKKLSEISNKDYIPKNRSLCENCIFYEECPLLYVCPSLDRLMDFEEENEEL